jgi:hypothetical protein
MDRSIQEEEREKKENHVGDSTSDNFLCCIIKKELHKCPNMPMIMLFGKSTSICCNCIHLKANLTSETK